MPIKLDDIGARQLRALRKTDAQDMVSMCREMGEDPAIWFEGEDWSDLDLRNCDLTDVSFRGAVMDRVTVTREQERLIRASEPQSMNDIIIDDKVGETISPEPQNAELDIANSFKNSAIGNALFDTKIAAYLRMGFQISPADIIRAAKRKTALGDAKLSRVDLQSANLCEADLRGADLRGADLRETALQRASLIGASLIGADLRGAKLFGADLSEADLSEANLIGAELIGANLRGANLRRANLHKAGLREAGLSGASLIRADFRGANLIGANLHRASLIGADLREADLRQADLREASLIGADLRGANLELVDCNRMRIDSARLEFANLKDSTNLTQGQIDRAEGNSETILPEGLVRPAHWEG